MPLLEINQSRHICASVRLDEVTAAQVDQYAAFIHASAMMLWTRRSTMSSQRTRLPGLPEDGTRQAGYPALRVRKVRAMVRRSNRQRSSQAGRVHASVRA